MIQRKCRGQGQNFVLLHHGTQALSPIHRWLFRDAWLVFLTSCNPEVKRPGYCRVPGLRFKDLGSTPKAQNLAGQLQHLICALETKHQLQRLSQVSSYLIVYLFVMVIVVLKSAFYVARNSLKLTL